jgi:hypothetical protein
MDQKTLVKIALRYYATDKAIKLLFTAISKI